MLLGTVPALLGFLPEASVVILGTRPPRETVGVTLRYPLPGLSAPGLAASAVGHALELLTSQDFGHAMAIGYGPDELVTPFIELLRERAGEHGLRLAELLRAENGRYWGYLCTAPACCSSEGTPYDPEPDPAAVDLLPPGVPRVLASRDALARLVAPADGRTARSMQRATRQAKAHAAEQAQASADALTRSYPIALAGVTAVEKAITSCRQGEGVVSHDDAAWLLVCLRDQWVRDDAWCRMEAGHREAHLRLWLDLTRLARRGYVAAPASLLAFVAWQSGNGALANVALDRALADDPRYQMARILFRLIGSGMSPEAAKPPFTTGQVAERYSVAYAAADPHDRQGE